jgi:phosphohistidine phosphatase
MAIGSQVQTGLDGVTLVNSLDHSLVVRRWLQGAGGDLQGMRRLILLRHGKAELAGLVGGDRERPLAERGRAETEMTARWLLSGGFVPDLVLVSPALRTRSTWDCARASFPDVRAEVRDRLYLAGAETICEILDDGTDDVDTIMVVGHNPGLQDLGVRLAAEGSAPHGQVARIADGFPPGAACVFRTRPPGDAALEAAYEPPRRPGEAPRWAFVSVGAGGAG